VRGGAETRQLRGGPGAAFYKYFVDLKYVDSFGKTRPARRPGRRQHPNALDGEQDYTCYGGGYASFSGGGATTEDRGALYLTLKTTSEPLHRHHRKTTIMTFVNTLLATCLSLAALNAAQAAVPAEQAARLGAT
jgi:hypothetical protein